MVRIEFLMAARSRIVYAGQTKLSGAMIDKPDNDAVIEALETAFQIWRGNTNKSPLDALEIYIAQEIDDGQELPVSNPEAYAAAQWLAQGNLASLPDPIPRAFVLYLAKAWANAGHYATVKAAITEILNTRTFV